MTQDTSFVTVLSRSSWNGLETIGRGGKPDAEKPYTTGLFGFAGDRPEPLWRIRSPKEFGHAPFDGEAPQAEMCLGAPAASKRRGSALEGVLVGEV